MATKDEKATVIAALIEQKRIKWGKNTLEDELSLEILGNMAKMGMNMKMIAGCFGIGVRTLQRRMNEYPDVRDAFHQGRMEGVGNVMNTAYALAVTGLDPTTTRWFVDKFGTATEADADKHDEDELKTIDVTPGRSGPMTQEELKKIVGETFTSDPMLRPEPDEPTK